MPPAQEGGRDLATEPGGATEQQDVRAVTLPHRDPGHYGDGVGDGELVEVAERVWVARHAWLDVNTTVVAGEAGLVIVDTLGSERAARGLADHVARLALPPGAGRDVVAVVNTHDHFDHVLGNDHLVTRWPGAALHAHESAAATMAATTARFAAAFRAEAAAGRPDPHGEDVLATSVRVPDRTFSSAAVVDLGDRLVELVHPGRGHTAGDLVVRLRDNGAGGADVLVAGDLLETSAPPAYGVDSWPLEWPGALDLVAGLTGPDTVVVPGHGPPAGRDLVLEQGREVAAVAATIGDLAARGVPVDRALAEGTWPWPADHLAEAVRRGYAHLPPAARRLPLV